MIPINEIKEEIKPLLDKRSGNQNELTALRNNFERTNEEIRTLEKKLNIEEIKIEELKSISNSSVKLWKFVVWPLNFISLNQPLAVLLS